MSYPIVFEEARSALPAASIAQCIARPLRTTNGPADVAGKGTAASRNDRERPDILHGLAASSTRDPREPTYSPVGLWAIDSAINDDSTHRESRDARRFAGTQGLRRSALRVVRRASSKRVVTMEYLEGRRSRRRRGRYSGKALARSALRSWSTDFEDGFLHADLTLET